MSSEYTNMEYTVSGKVFRSIVNTVYPSGYIMSVGRFPMVESSVMIRDELMEWFYGEN